jgi:hypothetical protein
VSLSFNKGLELLEDMVSSCIFIHDDWNEVIGVDDWDQYDLNPFLLGARICVVNTLKGFGSEYINFLKSITSFPANIVTPKRVNNSVCVNLLQDENSLGLLRAEVARHNLDLSLFYADPGKRATELTIALSTPTYIPNIHPPVASFTKANDRYEGKKIFANAGVPSPEGRVCQSFSDVQDYYDDIQSVSPNVIAKYSHRDVIHIANKEDLLSATQILKYPVLIERRYDFQRSPICHYISWKGQIQPLFLVNQVIKNWHHAGNESPHGLEASIAETIIKYTEQIVKEVPDFSGVIGVDYIVTSEGEVFAVDINPRFCSSTYPFFLLHRLGVDLETTFIRYETRHYYIDNVSAVYKQPDFVSFDVKKNKGLILFNPVYDYIRGKVKRLSFIAVSSTVEEVVLLVESIDRIISRISFGPS